MSGVVWSERAIQNAVYLYCRMSRHELAVPNSCLFAWESDVVSVLRSGFIHEFEVKVSRSDFLADARKDRARYLVEPVRKGYFADYAVARPNYFTYAVPEGLVTADEVPEYAGLIYVRRREQAGVGESGLIFEYFVREVKAPRRLHSDKIQPRQLQQLARALDTRYWRQRISIDAKEVESA